MQRHRSWSVLAVMTGMVAGSLAVSLAPLRAADAPAVTDPVQAAHDLLKETPEQRDKRMAWWRAARFGMFIHWGVYSVPAGYYNGKPIGGIGEWIMNSAKIPVADYQAFAKEFNPVKFNADDWVRMAKEAGMKYIVITSKHHDGFAMFKTSASTWNIVDRTPWGKDPLKLLAAACKKQGIKLGFYYSQAQDWNNPGGAAAGGHWDKAQDGDMDQYIDKVALPEVKDILSNYGPVACLWWDTPYDMTPQRAARFIPLVKKLQPNIIMNNRLGGGFSGDTETPEQFIPATGFKGRDWETCMTMNDTWGYKKDDNDWKSPEMLIRNLVDIASKGGNYLLNVGPTSEGTFPQPIIDRLAAIGAWMKVNHEAIYDTTASPFSKLSWGRCTKKVMPDGATLYLHVFNWPADGKLLVPGLKNDVDTAYLLSDPDKKALDTQKDDAGVTITLPAQAPDPISSTVVVKVKGKLNVEIVVPVIAQAADGSVTMPASEATLHGDGIQYENGGGKDNIGFWLNPADWVEWSANVTQPGKFTVTAQIASQGTGSFEVSVGDQKVSGKAPNTGDYTKFQEVDLGTLEIPAAGTIALQVKPIADGWAPMNLKSIVLKKAE